MVLTDFYRLNIFCSMSKKLYKIMQRKSAVSWLPVSTTALQSCEKWPQCDSLAGFPARYSCTMRAVDKYTRMCVQYRKGEINDYDQIMVS